MDAVNYQKAPLWRRLAAIGYDSLLVFALFFLAGFINLGLQIIIYGEGQLRAMTEQGHTLDGIPFYLILMLLTYGFFGFFWTRTGQTLGMQAWRICILNAQGHPISPSKSIIRFLVAIPSLGLAGIGTLWMLIDQDNRSWQDITSSSHTLLIPKK